MSVHEVWHVVVLATTVLAAGGAAAVVLAPLVFDRDPPHLAGARRLALLACLAAAVLLGVEWLVVHGG
jgi:hypothetical protein